VPLSSREGIRFRQAAAICESAVGTIKSRVYRARTRLARLLSIDSADMFGQDHTTLAF
jgi:RNA polymerase sigma-70 factor (ECF subfamily)